jgi:hypothetical protein
MRSRNMEEGMAFSSAWMVLDHNDKLRLPVIALY